MADEEEATEEEVVPNEEDEVVEGEGTQGNAKRSRTQKYGAQEDIDLCQAGMNVSPDAKVGTYYQLKEEKNWSRIKDYNSNTMTNPSNHTQSSISHHPFKSNAIDVGFFG
jgi:hypothetical protein